MKKIAILLTLITCITMTGCQKNGSGDGNTTSTSSGQAAGSKLSGNIYNFEVLINDKHYALPFNFEEMKSDSWEFKDEEMKLTSGESKAGCEIINGDKKLDVNFVNLSDSELSGEECKVGAIEITREHIESGTTLELAKNITMDSTKEEIIKAYGDPTKIDENENSSTLYYKIGIEEYVEFNIDESENKIATIKIENYNEKTIQQSTKEDEVKSDTKYPKRELGEDLFSKNFELDGVVYELPSTVEELSQHGWNIKYEKLEFIEPNKMGNVKFMKDSFLLTTIAQNNTSEELKLEDAPVRYVKVSKGESNAPLKLAGGIEIGTTKEELESALASYEVNTKESSKSIEYKLKQEEYEISIEVDIESSTVKTIVLAIYSKEKNN